MKKSQDHTTWTAIAATTTAAMAMGDALAVALLDARGFGMGQRGQRFAIIVKDGLATSVLIEGPGEFKVSAADHVLGQL